MKIAKKHRTNNCKGCIWSISYYWKLSLIISSSFDCRAATDVCRLLLICLVNKVFWIIFLHSSLFCGIVRICHCRSLFITLRPPSTVVIVITPPLFITRRYPSLRFRRSLYWTSSLAVEAPCSSVSPSIGHFRSLKTPSKMNMRLVWVFGFINPSLGGRFSHRSRLLVGGNDKLHAFLGPGAKNVHH